MIGDLYHAEKYIKLGYETHKATPAAYALCYYPSFLSHLYFDSGDLYQAQLHAEEAIKLSVKQNENNVKARSMTSLGRIIGEKMKSKSDEAENYILDGIDILKQIRAKPDCSRGYLCLGEFYVDQGEYGKAINVLKMAESEFLDMELDFWLSFSKSALGSALAKENPAQRDIAEDYIFQAIKIAQDHDFKPPLARGYLRLGELYADSGNKEKALENLKKAEAMYQEMGMGLWLGKTLEVLERPTKE